MSYIAIVKLGYNSFQIGILKSGFSKRLIDLKDEVFEENKELLLDKLGSSLGEISKEYKVKESYLCIPFNSVTAFFLSLPLRRRDEIKKAIPFELENRLPLPVNDYVLSFDIIGKKDKSSDIVVMAVLKKDIEEYVNILNMQGIKIKGIRITFVEVLNEFMKRQRLRDKKGVFIYKDGNSYSAALFSDNRILYLKHFKNLYFLINYLKGVTKEETLTFYYAGTDTAPNEIIPCEQVEYSLQKLMVAIVSEKKPLLIDFLDSEYLPYRTPYIVGIASVSLIAFFLYSLSVVLPYWFDYRELNLLNQKIKSIETEASDVLKMNKRLDDVNSRLKELVVLKNKSYQVIDILSEISRLLPEHSWVIMFKYNGQSIDISGFSERAIEILKSLERSKRFKNVRFSSPIVTMQNKERFVIRMEMEE